MLANTAATSGSASVMRSCRESSRKFSHIPVPAPDTRMRAKGSRISGCAAAVSRARAAATITAVDPTLVAMSQVSSSLRRLLMVFPS